MVSVDQGIAAQLRNIEADYGKPISQWLDVVRASGLTKHSQILAMLKTDHGMRHGAAHRVALVALAADQGDVGDVAAVVDLLYAGKRAVLRPVHLALIAAISDFGSDIETAPKKGYVSLRRAKQFAMIKPSTTDRIDVGLILKDVSPTTRLESAAGFNPLFTHRVRIQQLSEIDDELVGWLHQAYQGAG